MQAFLIALALVMGFEAGYKDWPMELGGPTNMGITIFTLERWRGEEVTPEDVAELTPEEAGEIYKTMFWDEYSLGEFSLGTSILMFDTIVLQGPKTIKWMQAVSGAEVDGRMGPETIAAIKAMKPSLFNHRLTQIRVSSYIDHQYRDGLIARAIECSIISAELSMTELLMKESPSEQHNHKRVHPKSHAA